MMVSIGGALGVLLGVLVGLFWADNWHARQPLSLTLSREVIEIRRKKFFGGHAVNRFSASIVRRSGRGFEKNPAPALREVRKLH